MIVLWRLAVSRGVFLVIGYWYLVIGAFRGGSLAVDFCSAAFWVFGEVFLLSHLVGDVRIVFFR